MLQPMQPSGSSGMDSRNMASQNKLVSHDLDGSLASLAGGLSIQPSGQVKK